jgi:3-hydroxyisobutyrate dehydrogenase-like beta-hydroxyacid dehydrogenase
MKPRIGFIGLGHMGLPMAQNIHKKGFPLCVYNRTKEKAAPLLEKGCQWADSPAAMAALCDIVISMVPNGPLSKLGSVDFRVLLSLLFDCFRGGHIRS